MQEAGMLSYDQIEAEIENSEVTELKEFIEDIDKSIAASEKLDGLLTTLSGKACFGFNRIRNELQTIRTWFHELTESKLAEHAETSSSKKEGDDPENATSDSKGSPGSKSGAYQSRDEALSALLKVASYFRRTEPHSPLSYSLEQAVRWGKMPLPDLLMELVRNDEVREEMFRRMGIQEKSKEEGN
jgi:type VI secretion system protein ImpA